MAKVYVGTYRKYNNGSLNGEWVDFEDFNDAEEFFDYIRKLHSDESDPEFMFQDYEDFPRRLYSESMGVRDIEKIYDWLSYDENERNIIEEYYDEVGDDDDYNHILEMCCGEYDSGSDFAESFVEECYPEIDNNLPSFISCHIDWEGVWRELTYDGYYETSHYIFNTNA